MNPETTLFLGNLLTAAILLATPLLLAALGELVVEKSGVLNLGVEGMMLVGALFGYIAAYNLQTITCLEELIPGFCNKEERVFTTTDYLLALLAAATAGATLAAVFGFLTQTLRANHVAVGLGFCIWTRYSSVVFFIERGGNLVCTKKDALGSRDQSSW